MSFNVSWDYKVEQVHGDVNPQGHYVYCFWDGDTPFYIGLGQGSRWRTHFYESNDRLMKDNLHKQRKMRKMAEEGRVIGVQIVAHKLSPKEAQALEVLLIKKYGRRRDGGVLTNLSTGGDSGASGREHTEEFREKHKERLRGKNSSCTEEDVRRAKLMHYYRGMSPKELAEQPALSHVSANTISGWLSKTNPNFSYILPDLPTFGEIYTEKKAEAVKLHAKGFTYSEVARILGLCRTLVARACKEADQ